MCVLFGMANMRNGISTLLMLWLCLPNKLICKARKYWNKLKQRLVKEGNKLVTHQLKMMAADGKCA